MQVIQQQCAAREQGGRQQNNRQVVPRQMPDLVIGSWEKSGRASRRMRGAGQLHGDDSQGGGEGGGEPAERLEARLIRDQAEELGYANADQGAEEVAEDQSARLGERALDCAEAEYGRGALVYA